MYLCHYRASQPSEVHSTPELHSSSVLCVRGDCHVAIRREKSLMRWRAKPPDCSTKSLTANSGVDWLVFHHQCTDILRLLSLEQDI